MLIASGRCRRSRHEAPPGGRRRTVRRLDQKCGLPAQVATAGRHHRCHLRPRCRRLLPGAEIHRRISARLSGRLSRPHAAGRGRQPGVDRLHPALGDSAGDDGRRPALGADRGQVCSGSHRSRHRRGHRGRAHRSSCDPRPGGPGEDGGQRTDHRLGRVGRPGRPDGAHLGRLQLVADATAEPVRRGRPHRGGAGYRRGYRRHLRRAAGRGGAGRVDHLPRRLRLPQPAARIHHRRHGLRGTRILLGIRAAVWLHRRRIPL